MKKYFLIMMMASLWLLSACNKTVTPTAEEPVAEGETPMTSEASLAYSNPSQSFSIQYPADWTFAEGEQFGAFNVFFEDAEKNNLVGILPMGELDTETPRTEPMVEEEIIGGKKAEWSQWELEDDKTLAIVKFKEFPASWNGDNRIQFMGTDLVVFEEMIKSLKFGDTSENQTYTNEELKYSFEYPAGWMVDDSGSVSADKRVISYPESSKPVAPGDSFYFDVHVDDRALTSLLDEVFSTGYTRSDIEFLGQAAYQFTSDDVSDQVWWVIPRNDQNYVIWTDQAANEGVKAIMKSFKFM